MYQVDKKGDPVPFSISAVTWDKERRRGGQRLTYEKAVVCNPKGGDKKVYLNRNDVRNIKGYLTNEIRGIHPLLITELNGQSISL